MRQVTEQELLDITADEFASLSAFDVALVVRVWNEAGRIKGLPLDMSDVYGDVHPYSDEGIQLFRNWLEEQGAIYYADCRDHFFLYKGVQQALNEGKMMVYAEDMS